MLQLRRYMQDLQLLPRNPFPDEVVPNADVLGHVGSDRVLGQVQRPHVTLVHNGTPDTLKRKDKTPQVSQENRFLQPITLRDERRLTRRKRDALLRPRHVRDSAPRTHHNRSRDRPAVILPPREIRVHENLQNSPLPPAHHAGT